MEKIREWYMENVYGPMAGHNREDADRCLARFMEIYAAYDCMQTMEEKAFRNTLDCLWRSFVRAARMISVLASIGLDVNPATDVDGDSVFGGLYGIQSDTPRAVLTLAGIESDEAFEEMDKFLSDLYEAYPEADAFPMEAYESLSKILRRYHPKLSWKQADAAPERKPLHVSTDRYHRHRALRTGIETPVTGYIWCGADHTYIIPANEGVSYDQETQILKAHAVEILPETVAVDMLFDDDLATDLFEGDTVRIGDEEIVLKLSDMDVLKKLTDPVARSKAFFRIRPNYEDVHG